MRGGGAPREAQWRFNDESGLSCLQQLQTEDKARTIPAQAATGIFDQSEFGYTDAVRCQAGRQL